MAKSKEAEMSFLDHLEVMRWHLVRSILAIVIMALVAFVFKEIVFDKIILFPKEPNFPTNRWLCQLGEILGLNRICINQDPFSLQTVGMAEQFSMHIMVSLIAGLIVAFPYVFFEFWRFVVPALHENEKQTASGAVFYTSLLFILGILFGYYVISPLSVNFLGNYKVSESVISAPTLRSYVETVSKVVLATGIVFQLPIVIYFLSKAGLVTPEFLKKYRRHSIIVVVTLSAIITPPDVFSQVLVALPLMVLYEIGISISKRVIRQEEAKQAEYDKQAKSKPKPKPAPAIEDEETGSEKDDSAPEMEEESTPVEEKPKKKEEVSTKKRKKKKDDSDSDKS